MIRLEKVSKRYGGKPVVRELDLTVAENSITVLLGQSGCGKTTTLKMINRLVMPSAGRIIVNGDDTANADPVQLRRGIGYVFQGIGLFPHRNVAENIATVPQLLGWPKHEREARVDELMELVGLAPADFRHRWPHELSGGQRQRVGVARALAARPRILLMDEPFGAVDPMIRAELQVQLKSLRRELGLTVVLVTHDVTEALLLADQVAVMRDGGLSGSGTPAQLVNDPPNDFVAQLIASPVQQMAQLNKALHGHDV